MREIKEWLVGMLEDIHRDELKYLDVEELETQGISLNEANFIKKLLKSWA